MMKIHTLFQKGGYGGAHELSWIINFPLKILKIISLEYQLNIYLINF